MQFTLTAPDRIEVLLGNGTRSGYALDDETVRLVLAQIAEPALLARTVFEAGRIRRSGESSCDLDSFVEIGGDGVRLGPCCGTGVLDFLRISYALPPDPPVYCRMAHLQMNAQSGPTCIPARQA